MSIVLNGNPGNVTTPLTATITALSNNGSGEIRVTTSAPHLFGPNDYVTIAVGAFTWTFQITVIDGTHFDLNGSVYNATDTGTATDASLTPQVFVPTDGDTFSQQLSGALSSIQALLDRDQFIAHQIQAIATPSGNAFAFYAALTTSTVLAVNTNGPPTILHVPSHNVQTGMWVNVAGATGNTAINGNWPVTVINSNLFSIPVQGSGTYGASSATVTPIVPPGVSAILIQGCGGGGGGEGGGGGTSSMIADDAGSETGVVPQGGGGQGAPLTTILAAVAPLASLAVAIGAGGAGGAGATNITGAAGSNGATSTVTVAGSTVYSLAGGNGAGGNSYGYLVSPKVTGGPGEDAYIAPGASGAYRKRVFLCGGGLATSNFYQSTGSDSNVYNFIEAHPGDGGASVGVWALAGPASFPNPPSTHGVASVTGQVGGVAGARGADSGTGPVYLGGAGGGGGGAGPYGTGGAGGAGSAGNSSGNSSVGGGTSAPAANTGAGGGGGGTAGAASGTIGVGGHGASGGSGQVTLFWVK